MLRAVALTVAMVVVLAACGDDDAGRESNTSSSDGVSSTTTTGSVAGSTTTADSVATTTTGATTTTTATTTTALGGSAVAFCLVDEQSATLDPYRGTPEEMAADVERARDLAAEYLATAPPEIEAEIDTVIPIFLDILDFVESTGYDEDQVDFDFIDSEFYGSDDAQAAAAAVDDYIEANC